MPYEVHDGRILTWSLEVHLTDHCNLRCVHCCTLSPWLAARVTPPAELERDLGLASRVLRPNLLKLTGGEPLLHPEVVRCAEIARASGVASQVSVTTNGLLLPGMPDAFFAAIDRLTLSHYASAPLPPSALASVLERCQRHGVVVTMKRIERFAQMDPAAPQDAEQALRVYRECWLRQRCHLLHRGRFYTCTRPPHLEDHLARGGVASGLAEQDGIGLDAEPAWLIARLVRYLESETPLASCRHCLGASGEWEAHRQRSLPASSGSPPM